MSPVTDFIIFCRLEDGNLTDSRLCRRFPILIPFARRFKNRRLFICLSALVFQTFSLDKKNLRSCVFFRGSLAWAMSERHLFYNSRGHLCLR